VEYSNSRLPIAPGPIDGVRIELYGLQHTVRVENGLERRCSWALGVGSHRSEGQVRRGGRAIWPHGFLYFESTADGLRSLLPLQYRHKSRYSKFYLLSILL
jgi:hypothetical protein